MCTSTSLEQWVGFKGRCWAIIAASSCCSSGNLHPALRACLWGDGETGFIDWIWSKRRHSPELGKADRLASLQGTMCSSCQNPWGEVTPGDSSSNLAEPGPGEVLCELWKWGQPPGQGAGLFLAAIAGMSPGNDLGCVTKPAPCYPRCHPGWNTSNDTPRKAFPDSVCNIPARKTGDAAFGRTAASSHHAAANLLTGRKVSNLSIKVLKTDLNKYPSSPSLFKLHTCYIPILY